MRGPTSTESAPSPPRCSSSADSAAHAPHTRGTHARPFALHIDAAAVAPHRHGGEAQLTRLCSFPLHRICLALTPPNLRVDRPVAA